MATRTPVPAAALVGLAVACGGRSPGAPPSPGPTVLGHRADQGARAAGADTDDDGVPDPRDACAEDAEDFDAFADDDGCPDPDNDGDGAPDLTDDCAYTAGLAGGCPTPCRVHVTASDDCFLDPSVFLDAHGVPQAQRIDEVIAVVTSHPTVLGLQVVGDRPAIVAEPLRRRLPGISVTETTRSTGRPDRLHVLIDAQRFTEGDFRAGECTAFGMIYTPARRPDCTR